MAEALAGRPAGSQGEGSFGERPFLRVETERPQGERLRNWAGFERRWWRLKARSSTRESRDEGRFAAGTQTETKRRPRRFPVSGSLLGDSDSAVPASLAATISGFPRHLAEPGRGP